MVASGTVALVAAVLGASVPAAQAAPAVGECQPGLGVGLAETPSGNTDPRASSYIVDHVKPGATFSRQFQICNGTPAAITVQLYPNAAVVQGGAFTVVEGRVANELSQWITVAPSSVTIPSGKRALARATVRVPAEASSGERYAVVLAELPAAKNAQGVSVASRVGVRVYLDVGAGGGPRSDFTIDTLQASRRPDGLPVVTAQVHNTGGRALDMRGSLRLTEGPGGLSAGPFPATLGTTLAPGETEPVTVVLSKAITGGPWLATLSLQSGLLERRASARITFPDAAGEQAPAVTAKNLPFGKEHKLLLPVAGGLIFLLALLLLVVGLITSRRKARERQAAATRESAQ
ncbi:MAG: DUF916 domain-containing protein [Actinobacteria bacterium]|nr:DUF916 domain-containing protein [Actinomycetota bacterium]MCA1720531.1 DUF916 domain-containing protein [Actinomycetota bacterium]